jgi:hypothetical protein
MTRPPGNRPVTAPEITRASDAVARAECETKEAKEEDSG